MHRLHALEQLDLGRNRPLAIAKSLGRHSQRTTHESSHLLPALSQRDTQSLGDLRKATHLRQFLHFELLDSSCLPIHNCRHLPVCTSISTEDALYRTNTGKHQNVERLTLWRGDSEPVVALDSATDLETDTLPLHFGFRGCAFVCMHQSCEENSFYRSSISTHCRVPSCDAG